MQSDGDRLQHQITALLRTRQDRLPGIHAEMDRWTGVGAALDDVVTALDHVREDSRTPREVKADLVLRQTAEYRRSLAQLLENLAEAAQRVSRDSVHIGVSGVARVGKSTLLQSLSGLSDDQIPTGSGIPVTAVRSRIHHSPTLRRAVIQLHTEASFLAHVIGPFHVELDLPGRPGTIQEFREWPYPTASKDDPGRKVELLRRLQDMRRSLDTYTSHLTGRELTVESLDELRPWVAYPTNDEIETASGPVSRRYLAVRDVRIETPFPHTAVRQLAVVDLPGLGENAVGAEQRHVESLRHEVDIVLVVKRPVEGLAYWGERDSQTLALIDEARGYVRDRRLFVSIVVNSGKADPPHLVKSLHDDIRRQVNDGVDDRFLIVYSVDATDPESVAQDLLGPLLHTLAETLPVMDRQVIEGVHAEAENLAISIGAGVADLDRALLRFQQLAVAPAEDLDDRVVELRKDMAVHLTGFVSELLAQVNSEDEDEEFVRAVESGYQDVVAWIDGGFDEGIEAWQRDAARTMITDGSSAPFSVTQLNRIRVEIGSRFGRLDDFLGARMSQVWDRLAAILRTGLGDLLDAPDGRSALQRLACALDEAPEPCPALAGAVEGVLAMRLDYRTQLYPRVRTQLGDLLTLEVVDPTTRRLQQQFAVDPCAADSAELLHQFVTGRARQAAHLVRTSLLEVAVAPGQVVHAFVEQFNDAFIRSVTAPREFKRIARSHRDQLWPGVYRGIEAGDARVANVRRATRALVESMRATSEDS